MAGIPGCRSRFLHQLGTGLFIILPPPPIPFSIAIIYKVSPFYLFTFCRAGNAKNTLPLPVKAKKGCFYAQRWAARRAACKKPYFCPPGVSVLNKKKEGRCTHIWCSCHLNLFQHLCIIFLLSGTRAFQMSLCRPIWDAFSVIPYKRDAAECAAALSGYSPENRKKDGKVYGKFHGAKRASGPL